MATETAEKILAFVNQQDFFWVRELRRHLNVPSADPGFPENSQISFVLKALRKSGAISCTEVRRGERQYLRNRICTNNDLIRKNYNYGN